MITEPNRRLSNVRSFLPRKRHSARRSVRTAREQSRSTLLDYGEMIRFTATGKLFEVTAACKTIEIGEETEPNADLADWVHSNDPGAINKLGLCISPPIRYCV